MKTNAQPTPTEYRKVLFRSKSEAIIARMFDLDGWLWEYEPEWAVIGSWAPDFWIAAARKSRAGIFSAIIEYKPSNVTDTYRHGLSFRFSELKLRAPFMRYLLMIVDPFNLSCPGVLDEWFDGQWWETEKPDPVFDRIKEAGRFRFDLETKLASMTV